MTSENELISGAFGLNDPVWLDPAITAVGILIGLIASAVFYKLLFPLILRFTQLTPTDLDTRMLRATRRPLTLAVLLLGVYLSIVIPLGLDAGQRDQVDTIFKLLGVVLGVFVVVALVSNAMDWYLGNLADRTDHLVDLRLFPLLRRVSVVLIYGLASLLILVNTGPSGYQYKPANRRTGHRWFGGGPSPSANLGQPVCGHLCHDRGGNLPWRLYRT